MLETGVDPSTWPARTWLFVPATRTERFAKAAASGADRLILDLEDAVAPGDKDGARRALREAVLPAGLPVYVRVNGLGTPWFEADLAAISGLPVAGVVLPKADGGEPIARAAAALPTAMRVVPLVESAAGVWNAVEVARGPRVERLAFGALDLQLDTGIRDEGDAMAHARSQVVLASRVAGVAPPVDSVSSSLDDEGSVQADAERGRRFGFAGKLCVHPRQVAPAHRGFAPTAAELEWAEALLAEVAARGADGGAAFSFRGRMIDRPVVERARLLLAQAGRPLNTEGSP
jgi:citrate lyase subunit beta/citryl-CoA lyase